MLGLTRGRLIAVLVAIVAGVAIGIGAQFFVGGSGQSGRSFVDTGIGGPFKLVDQDGKTRTDEEFRGKLMLVEFGYTFCPDVCPLGLQLFADVLDELGPDADNVQAVFITLDPARDTPDVLGPYIDHFSPRILGLTGTEADIATVAREFRVYYKLAADHATNPNYLVDHSAILYLMGRDGRFLTHFTHETPPQRVVATLRERM
jgi:cytochrome oxidase Cu insertion factor (SCO1/SenC/PrrC family)